MRALASLSLLLTLAACGDKDGDDSGAGADGGTSGGSISIPAGQNIATLTVAEGSAVLAAGDYELESLGFAPQRNQDEF